MSTALIVGPSPPPYNGMSIANEFLLSALRDTVSVVHLDTADRRGLANVGKLEMMNVALAGVHGFRLVRLLLSRRPQIVYVPIAQAWLPFLRDCLFLIPARIARRRVIIHLHGGYFQRFYQQTSKAMRAMIRYALGDARAAIVLWEGGRGLFDGIVPKEIIRVVPNGIPDYFENETARRDDCPDPQLLYLGLLCATKGVLDLLRALDAVKDDYPGSRAIFAGEWASREEKLAAHRIIEDRGLESSVEFKGPVGLKQKLELLRAADMFVFPSSYPFEGHPYTILEAMAAGLPVISTTIGSIPDTVQDGISGFLVEPGDVGGLVDRMGRLLRDGSLRKRMGAEARKRFLHEYTFDRYATRIRAVFAEVLGPGGQSAAESGDAAGVAEVPR